MNKESKLNLNAGDYAISHCDSDKTYTGLEVHKMLCDAYIAGNNDTLESEDEKIRKELIKHLKELSDWKEDEVIPVKNPSYYRQWASWLEKQGEKHPDPYNGISFEYNGHIWGMCARDNGVDISCDKHLIKHLEKQGEQKPAEWSEEDDKVRTTIINEFEQCSEWCCANGLTKEDCIDWLKSLKGRVQHQQEWSKEDEACVILLDSICESSEAEYYDHPDSIIRKEIVNARNWLKYLKGRVQPQHKQEWSEDDEEALEMAIIALEDMYDDDTPNTTYGGHYMPFDKAANQLKSLRPQNRWKPSDEQMMALLYHCSNGSVLSSLYNDLKKLKEE